MSDAALAVSDYDLLNARHELPHLANCYITAHIPALTKKPCSSRHDTLLPSRKLVCFNKSKPFLQKAPDACKARTQLNRFYSLK